MNFLTQLISEELIYALGWTVIHSLWQGMLIALMVAFLMLGLQGKSAKIRYEIASFSLFLVLISALVTFIAMYDSAATVLNEGLLLSNNTLVETGNSNTSFLQGFFQASVGYFNEHLPLIVLLWILGATSIK